MRVRVAADAAAPAEPVICGQRGSVLLIVFSFKNILLKVFAEQHPEAAAKESWYAEGAGGAVAGGPGSPPLCSRWGGQYLTGGPAGLTCESGAP